jgi:ABC-2 type transport system permease protein
MRAAPGSVAWLLRHELRIAWREARFFGARGRSPLRPLLIALVLQAAFLPFGWIIAHAPPAAPDVLIVFTSVLLVFAWAGMLAQTLVTATRVLYLRGDLDLLVSAPVSPRAVLTVRAFAVALTAITSWSLLTMLIVNALVVFGQFRWLLLYPVLGGLALVAAALALVLVAALFELLGPRRTRVAAQVVAACLGVGIVMLLQVPGWLGSGPDPGGSTVLPTLLRSVDAGNPLWWPARAALGEPVALAAWLVGTLGLFALVVAALGPRFARQAALAIGASAPVARTRRTAHFRSGTGAALRRKEWRLLRRDPWLVSQVVLPAVYLLPLAFLSWRGSADTPLGMALGTGGIAFVLVMIAGSLAGSLAWVAIAGEDAPELLACAPVTARQVIRAKLGAVLLPVAVLIAVPVAALALRSPAQALAAALGAAGAMTTAALLQIWHPQAGRRREFGYRHRLSILRGLFELAANVAWGGAAGLSVVLPELALVLWGCGIAIVPVLYVLRWRGPRGRAAPRARSAPRARTAP